MIYLNSIRSVFISIPAEWTLTIGIIWFWTLFAYKLNDNLRKWDRNNYSNPVNHGKQWRNTMLGMIPAGFQLWHPLAMQISLSQNLWGLVGFLLMVMTALMMFAWFWLFFDGLYNVFRKFHFFKVGSTDTPEHRMSKTDKFLKTLLPWECVAIKVIPLLLFTFLYIFIII